MNLLSSDSQHNDKSNLSTCGVLMGSFPRRLFQHPSRAKFHCAVGKLIREFSALFPPSKPFEQPGFSRCSQRCALRSIPPKDLRSPFDYFFRIIFCNGPSNFWCMKAMTPKVRGLLSWMPLWRHHIRNDHIR